ncbi:hypothetical protein Poly21_45800 [Allorhodopirellula heiligendammensis]|uniref:Inner membrane protein YjjP n=2 Tax=Allorhodopirellula heiligendammensis TaxID=2714739 RepID=A0A5C6BJP1_9BACT|nr:hypothetical protein Poly21_45800 [Allorhodopirellula heiligendammensis]
MPPVTHPSTTPPSALTDDRDHNNSASVPAERVIIELARNLHASGSPAYELDQRMEDVAAYLGCPATFFSTPTSLFITFAHEEGRTRLLRVYPCDTNLGRYAGFYATQRAIEHEGLSVPQAWERIQTLESTANTYSQPLQVLACGIAAACFGLLVGGNATVVAAAGATGLLTGGLLIGLSQRNCPAHLINIIAAIGAYIVASLVQTRFTSSSVELTSLAALIVLVPGLQLTISINELATQNLASGSARFAGAMMSLLTLVFGVYMGHALIHSLMPIPPSSAARAPEIATSMISILPLGLSLAVLFQARYRDIAWVLTSAFVGYGSLRLAGWWLQPFAAVWAAAVIAGVCSHLISHWRHIPPAITLMPALILLVPGSLGFFGLSAIILNNDVPGGLRIVSTMMLTTISIVAGLLTTDVIAPMLSGHRNRSIPPLI